MAVGGIGQGITPSVGDILETVAVIWFPGDRPQLGLNVRHFSVSAKTGDGATLGEIAQSLSSGLKAIYQPAIPQSAYFRGVTAQIINPTRTPKGYYDEVNGAPGTDAGEIMPRQVAGVISFYSNTASRSGRGRIYVPFPTEDVNDLNGRPSGAYMTILNQIATSWKSGFLVTGAGGGTVSCAPVIWSRKYQVAYPIVGHMSRKRWGTQRKRGDFGQSNDLPFEI